MSVLRFALLLALLMPLVAAGAAPSTVRVARTDRGYALIRNGERYFIRGGGGDGSLAVLAAIGGNSTRTWGIEGSQKKLDEAGRLGLSVTVGLWLGQQSYFDWSDETALARQRAEVLDGVTKMRDHPALLMWGLGNEMEMGGAPDTPAMWQEIERLAAAIHRLDPRHPVMVVVAEINARKVAAIKKWAPSVDVLGVNTYGPALSLPSRLAACGWDRPYVVSEFGTRGWWESHKTAWGAPLEPDSTSRGRWYQEVWRYAVEEPPRCLGGYVFAWGHKWERTPTWFGVFLPGTEERLAPVDAMATAWGRPLANHVPELVRLETDLAAPSLSRAPRKARVVARDADGDPLSYRWEVRAEEPPKGAEEAPPLGGCLGTRASLQFEAPATPGGYRLYVYVSDGHGGAATANVPFLVKEVP